MHDEYLSVVDDCDHVIDQRPRREIHALNLRHRAVHILVFNDQGQLFLQKRSMKKDTNKGLWDSSAAGHVDIGESYDQCATRELYEELGIKSQLNKLFKLNPAPELGMEFIQVYDCTHNGPFVLAADEIEVGQWQTINEVNQQVQEDGQELTLTFKVVWKCYLANSVEK